MRMLLACFGTFKVKYVLVKECHFYSLFIKKEERYLLGLYCPAYVQRFNFSAFVSCGATHPNDKMI